MAAGLSAGTALAIGGSVGSLTGAGTTTTDAAIIATDIVRLTGASNSGARLQPGTPGDEVFILNESANTIKIYPPSGGTPNAGSADAAISLTTLKPAQVKYITATAVMINTGAV
ncbi:MAG TPA: hypothetical protein VN541_21020 [Tepidisphaeraceae bacterium]|nr:hypothetical protein [Tepidisphaeraceae bacterium]